MARRRSRILEVATHRTHALQERSYHVVHISGHGQAGMIEMEDEDGQAVPMTAVDLANVIRQSGKRVPLIFLASCLRGPVRQRHCGSGPGAIATRYAAGAGHAEQRVGLVCHAAGRVVL